MNEGSIVFINIGLVVLRVVVLYPAVIAAASVFDRVRIVKDFPIGFGEFLFYGFNLMFSLFCLLPFPYMMFSYRVLRPIPFIVGGLLFFWCVLHVLGLNLLAKRYGYADEGFTAMNTGMLIIYSVPLLLSVLHYCKWRLLKR